MANHPNRSTMDSKLKAIQAFARAKGWKAERMTMDGVDGLMVDLGDHGWGMMNKQFLYTMSALVSLAGNRNSDGTTL